MRPRWTRRDRRRLAEHTALTLEQAHAQVEATARRTTMELAGPTPEQIDHWFKHSYGSWKRP